MWAVAASFVSDRFSLVASKGGKHNFRRRFADRVYERVIRLHHANRQSEARSVWATVWLKDKRVSAPKSDAHGARTDDDRLAAVLDSLAQAACELRRIVIRERIAATGDLAARQHPDGGLHGNRQ